MSDPHLPSNPLKLLGRATRGFSKIADAELREFGFAMGQLPVLMGLKGGRALSQTELARMAQVEQPSMAQMLARMERDGLVERVANEADGRSRLISLTALAAKRLPKAKAVLDTLTQRALEGFTAQEVAQLASLVDRLNANIDRMGGDDGASQRNP